MSETATADRPVQHAEPRALVLSLNSAVDITYTVAHLDLGGTIRVQVPLVKAGGKAFNVARVLAQVSSLSSTRSTSGPDDTENTGVRTTLIARFGAQESTLFNQDAESAGFELQALVHPGATRRTVAIVESDAGAGGEGQTTLLNEVGAPISAVQWQQVAQALVENLPGAAVAVISGSLPTGLPPDFLPGVIAIANAHEVPLIVDTSGEHLLNCAGAALVKPNESELLEATGTHTVSEGVRMLLERGVQAVLLSQGERGLSLYRASGPGYHGELGRTLAGNPTGAGDAAVAASAIALAHSLPEPEMLRLACALSAAAVLMPSAGEISPTWPELAHEVSVSELPPLAPSSKVDN